MNDERRDAAFWRAYLARREGTYEYRTRRYSAVADELEHLGLQAGDLLVDVGAGMCEFGRYLYGERGWSGQYVPIDGSIDGVDLNSWEPRHPADFFVAIEVIEHLRTPRFFIGGLWANCRKGVVITTPNTDILSAQAVMDMDETHITPIHEEQLIRWGGRTQRITCFHAERRLDTLLATWKGGAPT